MSYIPPSAPYGAIPPVRSPQSAPAGGLTPEQRSARRWRITEWVLMLHAVAGAALAGVISVIVQPRFLAYLAGYGSKLPSLTRLVVAMPIWLIPAAFGLLAAISVAIHASVTNQRLACRLQTYVNLAEVVIFLVVLIGYLQPMMTMLP